MINTTGVFNSPSSTLLCYNSPKIKIIGHDSNTLNTSILNVALELKDQLDTTTVYDKVVIDLSLLKTMTEANNLEASYMVENLYSVLELLLVDMFKTSNPDTTFEIV